jgi:hypothetical protein
MLSLRFSCAAVALLLAACTPALDWREVRPADSGASLLMPCKPTSITRSVTLAGRLVRLALHACSASGQTWALAVADVGDPARVGPALTELRDSAAANLSAAAPDLLPLNVTGATPNDRSGRARLAGRLADDRAVEEELAVFSKGTRVYQATALGPSVPADAAETFFSSLRVGP